MRFVFLHKALCIFLTSLVDMKFFTTLLCLLSRVWVCGSRPWRLEDRPADGEYQEPRQTMEVIPGTQTPPHPQKRLRPSVEHRQKLFAQSNRDVVEQLDVWIRYDFDPKVKEKQQCPPQAFSLLICFSKWRMLWCRGCSKTRVEISTNCKQILHQTII